jgi:thymidylate synthase ThyX
MTIEAKVIEDSISDEGKRICTLQVKFHRFILPEFNTHRVFSRNFSSSRAIPTKTLLKQVAEEPAMPVHWGKNQPGMQAAEELDPLTKRSARASWIEAAKDAALRASVMSAMGCHKQIVNRVIEPYLWAHGVVTSTEWDNWFSLRAHEDAQPEIHELALRMREAMDTSIPQPLKYNEWHLPYVTEEERNDPFFKLPKNAGLLQKISAARCCRVSYLKHDGTRPNISDDLNLFERLAGAVPLHASPLEHQATPDEYHYTNGGYTKLGCVHPHLHGNFSGWVQYRKLWEREIYGQ